MTSLTGCPKSVMHQSFNVKTAEDAKLFYDKVARDYDSIVSKVSYNGAAIAAKLFGETLPEKNTKILDFCAGTGILGSALYELGYRNIDAHDGSVEMLKVAESRGIYKEVVCELLHVDVEPKFMKLHSYDAVVTSGSFCPGNLNAEYLYLLPRLVKEGGLIMIATRRAWIDKDCEDNDCEVNAKICWSDNFRHVLQNVMQQEKLELVDEKIYPDYCDGKEGIYIILKRL